MWLWFGIGCPPSPERSSIPSETASPTPSEPLPSPDLQLAHALAAPVWTVIVEEAHGSLRLEVEGGGERREIERPEAPSHRVRLVGLVPGAPHTLTATLARPDGSYTLGPLSFETDPVPDAVLRWPFEVLAHDPLRADPGWLLLSPYAPVTPDGPFYPALLLDDALQIRWWSFPERWMMDLRVGPDGALWSFAGSDVVRYDWDGTLLSRFAAAPEPGDLPLPVQTRAHHEVWPEADGSFWTFDVEVPLLDAYPVSYTDPAPVPGSYPVEDNPVLHVGADGALLSRWSLVERLDPSRIGFTSLTLKGDEGYDWTHANGLALDGEGGVIVSLRNQDAVVRFDADGALDWILGDPLGWSAPLSAHLLAPVGDTSFFYHQHAPEWHPDERLLVVFDNQTYGHTPYGPPPAGPLRSRVVGYEIDAVARTARERFSFGETTTGPLFSRVMGDADLLPNGNLLVDFGYLEREDEEIPYDEQGLGLRGVRLVEFDPDAPDAPALDLRLVTDGQRAPEGFQLYRARKIAPPVP